VKPEDGRITEDQRARAVKWLDKHWKDQGRCSVCHANGWQMGDYLVEIRPFRSEGFLIGGPVYPQLILTCNTCGHTVLINAISAGVLAPPASDVAAVEPRAKATGAEH